MTNQKLKGSQRRFLRGQVHNTKPLVHIGQKGLTKAVISQLNEALDDHEVIKVKYLTDDREEKATWTAAIAEQLHAEPVGAVGHTAVFYRQQRDPERRKIHLPK